MCVRACVRALWAMLPGIECWFIRCCVYSDDNTVRGINRQRLQTVQRQAGVWHARVHFARSHSAPGIRSLFYLLNYLILAVRHPYEHVLKGCYDIYRLLMYNVQYDLSYASLSVIAYWRYVALMVVLW